MSIIEIIVKIRRLFRDEHKSIREISLELRLSRARRYARTRPPAPTSASISHSSTAISLGLMLCCSRS